MPTPKINDQEFQKPSEIARKKEFIKKPYIPLKLKLYFAHVFAFLWLLFSIYLSKNWVHNLGEVTTLPIALFIIAGVAYIPGYINAFMVFGLLFDKQPPLKVENPTIPVSVLIACYNEEKSIRTTLEYVAKQTYEGPIKVIVIDNNSKDKTFEIAQQAGDELGLNIRVIRESHPGKHHALNAALKIVDTEWLITLDADTILMKDSVKYLIRRALSSPKDVCAVAGSVLTRNSRKNFWTKIQEWDYFLGIASIKRLQGMFQGTLVAQGAYSLYKTEVLKSIGRFPDVIGEDIVITWRMLEKGWKVYFEPLAVAFTEVPETFIHFQRQRSRWARGMIEALKRIKPWKQPLGFVKYATTMNLIMPYLDFVYTLFWLPGVALAFFGIYWVAGPMTLFVLPLALLQNFILYTYQKKVFKQLNLRIRKNRFGFVFYVLLYQAIMSPISLWGYMEEVFQLKRVWK
ncbi:glycosyltransferase family 2 protein [Calidifontibacillus erzurumensis]|uniref:Glycosyltransferase family 2 protein n=1 Tax=Calidifontibacillus erzurumensis TaxID=2741433 RepID=A0A8J8GJI9_9BACI|nr:glycosyltransferase [Calidifontibacillus erzurumensis]NSL52921.1 glycosyltransferase family 2 protein [Calidifontibacillus erzurumensis]